MGEEEIEKKICCLCGDVGFLDSLVRCLRCGYRLQHKYCSRYYPDNVDMEKWGCEWCIHRDEEEEKKTTAKRQISNVVGPKDGIRAKDRWRKLAKAAKMGSGRRYKLLADVICS